MNGLVLAPVLVPLVAAALGLVAWRHPDLQRYVAVGGSAVLLVAGVALLVNVERDGIQTLQLGDWPAPFGITMVADLSLIHI